MDKAKIIELEKFILANKRKPETAANMMSDIIGVLIGVKPIAFNNFEMNEFLGLDIWRLMDLLRRMELTGFFFRQDYFIRGKLTWCEDIYISHRTNLAARFHEALRANRQSTDDFGQIIMSQEWKDTSREIGQLLGYPDTAIKYYISNQDIEDPGRQERLSRNRFYIHSADFEEQEYQAYDRKIYQAISEYAPKTAEIFTADKDKRWL